MNNCQIIVVGTSHHNTLSMIKALGKCHIEPIVLLYACSSSFVAKSRFVAKVLYFATPSEVINHLKSEYCNFVSPIKPTIISCTDEIASKLDLCQEELLPYLNFFHTSKQGHLTYYMDKRRQVELASKVGFIVPWSAMYTTNLDKEKIPYPCILKPIASINGGKRFSVCSHKQELEDIIDNYGDIDVIVQEFVVKDREIVILGLTIDRETIIPAYIEKYREVSGGTTFSKVKYIDELPSSVIDACSQMVAEIGYEGLWGIECIQSGGKYYFIELNLRNDATTFSVAIAGVNLPYHYVARKLGLECDLTNNIKSIYSIVEHNDLMYILHHRLSLWDWCKDLKRAECKYFLSMNDYGPTLKVAIEYIKVFVRKIFKRKHCK